ncbi:MAG: DUF4474 domain-containing protein [Oscillospiraceae bacterium]|nr:DUF4474 domain-containing protein [Oscillospiraceae bacterium]
MTQLISAISVLISLVAGVFLPGLTGAPAKQVAVDGKAMYFETPPKDDPYYEDFPGNHAWQRTDFSNYDPAPLREYVKTHLGGDFNFDDALDVFAQELLAEDFQVILLNYPRVAFVYRAESGDVKGITDEGLLHLGFSYNVPEELFYATKNPWMRVMGYNEFYDWLAAATTAFDLHTRRIRFSYGGLDYQVQLWKGKYFFEAVMGAEVGFYTKPQERSVHHYDVYPLEKMMPISMKLYSDKTLYYDLPPEAHWWSVMMKYRKPIVAPDMVTLESTIAFDDPGLRDAFFAALTEQHPDIEASLEGDVVWLRWNAQREASS